MSNVIYMDNAATTATRPEVLEAMLPYFTQTFGNPSSIHGVGREARKAVEAAKKHLVTVPMEGTTIPHAINGEYGTAKVVLLPAEEGAGVIAGGGARAVLELAGVKDIRTKTFGTNNRINTVKATLEGLKGLRNAETVAKMRGKTVEEIIG